MPESELYAQLQLVLGLSISELQVRTLLGYFEPIETARDAASLARSI
jgi:hypothetical protein